MTPAVDPRLLWQQMVNAQSAIGEAVSSNDPRARDEAKLAFQTAQFQLSLHFARLTKAPTPDAPAILNGRLYPYPNYDEARTQSGGLFPTPFVGLCLSGGGSRSAAASMGALRALRSLGFFRRLYGPSGASFSFPREEVENHLAALVETPNAEFQPMSGRRADSRQQGS